MKKNKKKLLFVCLGNICRSPAAEGVMKTIVEKNNQSENYEIDSAGIGNWHVGQLPDSRMRKCGEKRGYYFNSRARQFTPHDFLYFDIILVMDNDNYQLVTKQAQSKEEKEKVKMLAQYLARFNGVNAIPDPYYGDEKDFNYALDLIEDACENLFQMLQKG